MTLEQTIEAFEEHRRNAAEDYTPALDNKKRQQLVRGVVRDWEREWLRPFLKRERYELCGATMPGWDSRRLSGQNLRGISIFRRARKRGPDHVTLQLHGTISGVNVTLGNVPEEQEDIAARLIDMVALHFRPYRQRWVKNWDACLNGDANEVAEDLEQNRELHGLLYQLEGLLLSTGAVCPWQYRSPKRPTSADREARNELLENVQRLTDNVAALTEQRKVDLTDINTRIAKLTEALTLIAERVTRNESAVKGHWVNFINLKNIAETTEERCRSHAGILDQVANSNQRTLDLRQRVDNIELRDEKVSASLIRDAEAIAELKESVDKHNQELEQLPALLNQVTQALSAKKD